MDGNDSSSKERLISSRISDLDLSLSAYTGLMEDFLLSSSSKGVTLRSDATGWSHWLSIIIASLYEIVGFRSSPS